jgi:hypothetical protein
VLNIPWQIFLNVLATLYKWRIDRLFFPKWFLITVLWIRNGYDVQRVQDSMWDWYTAVTIDLVFTGKIGLKKKQLFAIYLFYRKFPSRKNENYELEKAQLHSKGSQIFRVRRLL